MQIHKPPSLFRTANTASTARLNSDFLRVKKRSCPVYGIEPLTPSPLQPLNDSTLQLLSKALAIITRQPSSSPPLAVLAVSAV